jgi:flagellar basal body rod protein FlgB
MIQSGVPDKIVQNTKIPVKRRSVIVANAANAPEPGYRPQYVRSRTSAMRTTAQKASPMLIVSSLVRLCRNEMTREAKSMVRKRGFEPPLGCPN